MRGFVRDYLSGVNSRLDWDLDFNHYLIENYPYMERENFEIADCFVFYLSDNGYDVAENLPDDEHLEYIREQFDEFKAALRDGLL
jgi:hypothetical protein